MFGNNANKIIKQLRRINELKARLDEEIMIYNIMLTGSPNPQPRQMQEQKPEKDNDISVV